MTPDRKALLAHLQIAPLYLGWGHRIGMDQAGLLCVLIAIDNAGSNAIVEVGTLDDCLRAASERGAL